MLCLLNSSRRNLTFFDSPQYFIVQTNFLLQIFRKFFAKTFESGAVRFWEKGYEAQVLNVRIHTPFNGQNRPISWQTWVHRVNLATTRRSFEALKESNMSPTVVDYENLSPAFELLVVGLGISRFVLVNERWPLQAATCSLLHAVHRLLSATYRIILQHSPVDSLNSKSRHQH